MQHLITNLSRDTFTSKVNQRVLGKLEEYFVVCNYFLINIVLVVLPRGGNVKYRDLLCFIYIRVTRSSVAFSGFCVNSVNSVLIAVCQRVVTRDLCIDLSSSFAKIAYSVSRGFNRLIDKDHFYYVEMGCHTATGETLYSN